MVARRPCVVVVAVVAVAVASGCVDVDDPGVVDRVRVRGAASAGDAVVVDDGAVAGVSVYDLGVVDVDASDVVVDVDDDVRSVSVVVAAVGGDAGDVYVVVDDVKDGAGAVLVAPDAGRAASRLEQRLSRGFVGPFLSPDRMLAHAGGGAFVVGAHPALPRRAGTWSVGLGQGRVSLAVDGQPVRAASSEPVHVVGVVDTRPASSAHTLHLALHFTGARGLAAANAGESAVVATAIETVTAAFAAAGIDVVVDGSDDVDDSDGAVVALADGLCDGGGLTALLRALPATPGALDVVFIDHFTCAVRGVVVDGIAGLAGGVPADAFADTGTGGVAVALAVVDADPAYAGAIVAHEVGHALGLHHIAEQASGGDPLVFDTLDDTSDEPGFADNLMVAAPSTETPSTTLTPQQAALLRSSPWLAE
jgi:hypothetical protein